MLNDNQIRQLTDMIRSGFISAPYPGDGHIVAAGALIDPEVENLLNVVKGKTWQEIVPLVTSAAISGTGDMMYFYTPAGWRYFLPAYLTYLLRYDIDNFHSFDIMNFLKNVHIEHFEHLSPEERRTVADVLRALTEVSDSAAIALENYWGQYESNPNN